MDKKLFELNENTTPADSKRLAFGDASSGAENITLANFYTRLMNKLGFLKVANYFSEYLGNNSAQTTAQLNLNIYSKGEVDAAILGKANKSNVIEKDSTTAYTPTLGTHPVNKSYADGSIIFAGSTIYHDDNIPHNTITKIGGVAPVTGMTYGRPFGDFVHEFYHNLNISNYIPIIQIHNAMNRDNVVLGTVSWDNNKVSFKAETTDNYQDSVAKYTITLLRI